MPATCPAWRWAFWTRVNRLARMSPTASNCLPVSPRTGPFVEASGEVEKEPLRAVPLAVHRQQETLRRLAPGQQEQEQCERGDTDQVIAGR